MREDFFSLYLQYTSGNEAPTFFHRWSAVAGIGALLSRNFFLQHGQFTVNPNIYCMLIGNAGTKKSTAIKIMRKLIQQSGYSYLGPKKITKEKFFIKLATQGQEVDSFLDGTLSPLGANSADPSSIAQMFIAADEFNEFFGNDVMSFVSTLGDMWDWEGPYENEVKNSTSSYLYNPTISILGGNTPTGFAEAFPPKIIGQGFFSRLILVYAEPTGAKITWPRAPSQDETAAILEFLFRIQQLYSEIHIDDTTKKLLDKIYHQWKGVDDVRFESYSNRRFTHLLKLCLIHTAARLSTQMEEDDVIFANTVLTHTEHLMPKALGEFGKAKHADVSHKILQVLDSSYEILTIRQLWKSVHNDLDSLQQLGDILRNLKAAEKLQEVPGGFIAKRKVIDEVSNETVDYNFLTETERKYVK